MVTARGEARLADQDRSYPDARRCETIPEASSREREVVRNEIRSRSRTPQDRIPQPRSAIT
jgi:hypothetical protein